MQNNRAMPWKEEKDPYKIWISEIILQQTRVQQGLEYYKRFIKAFPDLTYWQMRKAKYLNYGKDLDIIAAAEILFIQPNISVDKFNGRFPITL